MYINADNFTSIYIIFIVVCMIYRIRRITKSYSGEDQPGCVYAHFSYAIMLFLYLLVIISSIFEYFYCIYVISIRESINLWVSLAGVLMYVSVIPVRAWSIKYLGKYMSCDVKVTEGHRLVKEGPYRYIRHPLILCVILEVIGFTLVSNSYFSTLGAILIFLPFMLYRIKLEERALIEKFGHEYIDYQHTTWMLLPIPWRRKR